MFTKKRYDNTVEYQLFGKTIAKKIVSPYGYHIYIKNTTIFKKLDIEKLVTHHEAQAKNQILELKNNIDQIKDQVLKFASLQSDANQHIGMHIIGKQNLQLQKINKKLDILNAVHDTHQESFKPYKNKFHGQDVVIMATGPTLKQYTPIPSAIHIGVNNAYKYEHTILDFLFIQDILGLQKQIHEMNAYAPGQCQKFYGDVLLCDHCAIPESYVIQTDAKRYYTGGMGSPFLHNIASCLLPDFGSVVFPALAFALYTNPKRLYLVGCDCSDIGYFDNDKPGVSPSLKHDMPKILEGWQAFKQFSEHFYPDTEIISVNPVGLKNMFKECSTVNRLKSTSQ